MEGIGFTRAGRARNQRMGGFLIFKQRQLSNFEIRRLTIFLNQGFKVLPSNKPIAALMVRLFVRPPHEKLEPHHGQEHET